MRKEKGPCEADVHVDGCPCGECTTRDCAHCHFITLDHITPSSIARAILGWSRKQINDLGNQANLSIPCHKEKDRTTQKRLQALFRQRKGGEITLEEVQGWADQSEYNQ